MFELEKDKLNSLDEKDNISSLLPQTKIGQLINCLISCLPNCFNYTEYFELLFRLASLDDSIAQYFVNRKIIGRIFDFIFDGKIKKKTNINSPPPFYQLPFLQPEIPLIGAPTDHKEKKFVLGFLKKDKSPFAAPPSNIYMWKLLEHLILRSKVPSNNPGRINSNISYQMYSYFHFYHITYCFVIAQIQRGDIAAICEFRLDNAFHVPCIGEGSSKFDE